MKVKDFIKILEQYPEHEIYSHSSYGDCYTPLIKIGKDGNKQVLIIYSDGDKEHISDEYVDFTNET